jgi:hypothetical protein
VAGTCCGRMIVVTAEGTGVFSVSRTGVGTRTLDVEWNANGFAGLVDKLVDTPFNMEATFGAVGILGETSGGTVSNSATAEAEGRFAKGVGSGWKGVWGLVLRVREVFVIRGKA